MTITRARLGIVTIGQSPRTDLHQDLHTLLGNSIELMEIGALDGLDLKTITTRYPIQGKTDVLVSRMRDGAQVTISESDLEPLLINAIHSMQQRQPEVLVVLCTGELPDIAATHGPVIQPKDVVRHFFAGLNLQHLAVMSPESAQITNTRNRWQKAGFQCDCSYGSPYQEEAARYQASQELKNSAADIIYLDCMGYTLAQARQIAQWSGKTVVTARQIIFKTVETLLLNTHSMGSGRLLK
ncbi:AroM family protein [Celerinatantimonas sp. YJH-8]|uniref:AroM family protein n=1 Tax=Celerinatantimonas sp. YJH-8 TaxID=3228714 RepID=UPI0038BEEA7F